MLWLDWLRLGPAELAALHRSEALYRLVAEHATDMIVRLDLEGTRTYVSPAARSLLGYEPAQLEGISTFVFVHPADVALVRERLHRVVAGEGDQRGINRVIRADGRVIWVEASLRLVRDAAGAPRELVSVVRDVTAQQVNEQRIAQLAATDALTGLPNRRALQSRLEALLASGARCALLFIDLDNFKPVNDLHGHAAGDAVLAEVAGRLKLGLPPDAMVARLGGDEFAVLLPEGASPAAVAQQILRLLAAPLEVGGVTAALGGSIGIATSMVAGGDAAGLLRAADQAMYQAKREGRGRLCFFTEAMAQRLRDGAQDPDRLRGALAAGEMLAAYQPLVALADRRLVGLAVQPRWQHPERGLLPPDEFMAQIARGGLGGALFAELLRQACRDAAGWPGALQIALALPAQQLLDPALPARVLQILAEAGIAPSRLELELVQVGSLREAGAVRGALATLQGAGVCIALAGFGTGAANLATLRQLRVDRLQVAADFATDPAALPYAGAIIRLAQNLGLGSTAEGLAEEASLDRLAALGCERGQGPLFGRPRPAGALGDWLQRPGPHGGGAAGPRGPALFRAG